MNSYFRSSMQQYELEQARRSVGSSAIYSPVLESNMPDVDMGSINHVLVDRTTMIVNAETSVIRDYHR